MENAYDKISYASVECNFASLGTEMRKSSMEISKFHVTLKPIINCKMYKPLVMPLVTKQHDKYVPNKRKKL